MTPTKKQKERRRRPFRFTADGYKSWFYLRDGTASFHQRTVLEGLGNVHGLRISRLIAALKACGYIALLLVLPVVAEAKDVAMPYEDFLQVIAKVEHSEKLRNKAMAENGVLIKLNGEKDTIIKIQADQIQACEKIVQQQEQLGSTQEQINQAVEATLTEMTQRLEREQAQHKWYTLGGAGVGGILVLVIMAVVN